MAVPMVMFMRFCELDLSSLKIGNSCPSLKSATNAESKIESGLHILGASEGENLYRKCRDKAGRELDEVDLPTWYHALQWAKIAYKHNQNKVPFRGNRQLS